MNQPNLEGIHVEGLESKLRFRIYWMLSAFSIFVFLIFMYIAVMEQYPREQFPLIAGLGMCSISGVLSGASLAVGLWKFTKGNAPVMVWPLGPLLGIPLAIEFGLSAIGFSQMIARLL